MFVGIDHNYLKKIQSKNIELEVQNINNFITKNKKIDAIILGGSNAVQGLSAEQLSEITTKKFYNLSLDYEGGNNFDYYNSIVKKTTNIDRKKVRLVLYSTLRYFEDDVNVFQKFHLKSTLNLNLLPNNSLITTIKSRGFDFFINYVSENNAFKSTKYGDRLKVPKTFNSDLKSFDFVNNLPIKLITEDILLTKKNYTELFPNALFILVTPPIYNTNPEFQNNFILELSKSCLEKNINFIHQPPVITFQPIWTNNTHLNSDGRNKRTDNLYKSLNNNYSLKEIFY